MLTKGASATNKASLPEESPKISQKLDKNSSRKNASPEKFKLGPQKLLRVLACPVCYTRSRSRITKNHPIGMEWRVNQHPTTMEHHSQTLHIHTPHTHTGCMVRKAASAGG
jgi:uncharacterized protein YbaR (Trm112 family)